MDSPEAQDIQAIAEALERGESVPLVVVGDEVKKPPVISFAWIVNEFKEMGVLD